MASLNRRCRSIRLALAEGVQSVQEVHLRSALVPARGDGFSKRHSSPNGSAKNSSANQHLCNTTANNDNNNHSNNDNNNNSYRSKGDAEEMSTLTASSMPGLPGRGNGVRVPDQDQRPASVPPVLKRPGRKRRPMSRVSLETLKNFGNLLRDGGLPKPVETTEDPRGNQMSITSTGHIHYPRTLPRSSATRKASCISDVMELKDSDCHLARALVAVGVARPGLTRIGTEPIRGFQHISRVKRLRSSFESYGVGSSGRSSAAPGQPSSCHDGQQLWGSAGGHWAWS